MLFLAKVRILLLLRELCASAVYIHIKFKRILLTQLVWNVVVTGMEDRLLYRQYDCTQLNWIYESDHAVIIQVDPELNTICKD